MGRQWLESDTTEGIATYSCTCGTDLTADLTVSYFDTPDGRIAEVDISNVEIELHKMECER